jgi:hypothetical protein
MNDRKNCFTLTTAPRKNFLLIGVLALGLALWGGGLVAVASALLRGQIKEAGFFVVFFLLSWLAGWLLGGGLALYGLLWMLCGTETLVATPEQLTLTRRIGGYQRVRHYDAAKIRNLRLAEATGVTDFLFSLRPFGIGNGRLTCDCVATVVTFAEGIDRVQAQAYLAELGAILSAGRGTAGV